MKNEKPNDTHAENKKAMPLGDDMLKDVAGGGGSAPDKRAFDLDEYVKVRIDYKSGAYRMMTGIIADYEFDYKLYSWTYQVQFGKYQDSQFFPTTGRGSAIYYPQEQIIRA